MNTPVLDYKTLMSAARRPHDVGTLALAGVISMRSQRKPPYDAPIAGLNERELKALKYCHFPHVQLDFHLEAKEGGCKERMDEFDDLLSLLMAHRTVADDKSAWLAHAVASASMGENHLWQDMGLPNRAALSQLLGHYFTSLASRNVNDMKWKKFFYRQLCALAGLTLCRSPSCGECCDFQKCFGPEEAVEGGKFLFAVG